MWTNGVFVEDQAITQLENVASLPFIFKHVAAMPDVHFGYGATVGSVIPTIGAVVPAAVGVDIGCGMTATQTSLTIDDLPGDLESIRAAIECAVPHGRTDDGKPTDKGAWPIGGIPEIVDRRFNEGNLNDRLQKIVARHPRITRAARRAPHHLGTLGTGNHFIEICLDESNCVWVMLHSGSRGIGAGIGGYFMRLAKKEMERWFVVLPDKDLAYLPEDSPLFHEYMNAALWAQQFALLNRTLMMEATLDALDATTSAFSVKQNIDCHHNYVAKEHHYGKNVWVTRKGAVRAREGDLGIIPGSMGTRSFIVVGKGNRDSFTSCSHGAGRAMSRTEARRRFSLQDHEAATEGIVCHKGQDVLDETPGAYKDIDAVMQAQSDLVDIKHTLRQIIVVKGV